MIYLILILRLVFLFADDVKLYNLSCNQNDLQTDLDLIYDWSEKLQLKMSLQKCLVLHLGKSNPKCCYKISDFELPKCSEIKDLGVYISQNLSNSVHCNQIIKKARLISNLIIKSFFSKKTRNFDQSFSHVCTTNFRVCLCCVESFIKKRCLCY